MASQNPDLAKVDRATLLEISLWVIDQIQSGSRSWRDDFKKFYPALANFDPTSILLNVTGLPTTTLVFKNIIRVRQDLKSELDQLQKLTPTAPGQITLPQGELPQNYFAVLSEIDTILDQKRHETALSLKQTLTQQNIPQQLGVALTDGDIDSIVGAASDKLVASLPYSDEKSYPQLVFAAVKGAVEGYDKTAKAVPNLNFENNLQKATSSFAQNQKANLTDTAAISHVATVATLIDPSSPASKIIQTEIAGTINAYQSSIPEGDFNLKKAEVPLANYSQNYVAAFVSQIAPIVAGKKKVDSKEIKEAHQAAEEFVYKKFEDELSQSYTPEELAFFRENFSSRMINLAKLQLGLIPPGASPADYADFASPHLAAISFTAIAGASPLDGPEEVVQKSTPLFAPPSSWLVPQAIKVDSAAAYLQSEPLSVDPRFDVVEGIGREIGSGVRAQPAKTSLGPEDILGPLRRETFGNIKTVQEAVSLGHDGNPNPYMDPAFPTGGSKEEIVSYAKKHPEKTVAYATYYPNLRALVLSGLAEAKAAGDISPVNAYIAGSLLGARQPSLKSLAWQEFKKTELYQSLRLKILNIRYSAQRKMGAFFIRFKPQNQRLRSGSASIFKLLSKPLKIYKLPGKTIRAYQQARSGFRYALFRAREALKRAVTYPFRKTGQFLWSKTPEFIKRPLRLLGNRLKIVFNKLNRLWTKISAVLATIGIAITIGALTAKFAKRAGSALAALYLWLMQFNPAILIGALIGGTVGFVAGAIGGAILGFQAGVAIASIIAPFLGPFAPLAYIIIVPVSTVAGAVVGGLIGAGAGTVIGASAAALFTGSFGTGAMIGGYIGLIGGPFAPVTVPLFATIGWAIGKYVAPFFQGAGSAVAAAVKGVVGGASLVVAGFFSSIISAIVSFFQAAGNFFGNLIGAIASPLGAATAVGGVFGISTIVIIAGLSLTTIIEEDSAGLNSLVLTKTAPSKVDNPKVGGSSVAYTLTVADNCATEVTLTDTFTTDAPLTSLDAPTISDPSVEGVTVEPDFSKTTSKTNPKAQTPLNYVGQVKWTIRLKQPTPSAAPTPQGQSKGCGSSPDDAAFLPPSASPPPSPPPPYLGLTPPNPNDGSGDKPDNALIEGNKAVYIQASQKSGVPWHMIAGFHFVEGGNRPDASLANGGCIGPGTDITGCGGGATSATSYCSNIKKEGVPYNDGTHCYWLTLTDSAIWAAKYLKEVKSQMCYGKFGDWKDAVCSLGAYNGYQSRYDGNIKTEFVKGGLNGYSTSYLDGVQNWFYNSSQNPPFTRYGAYTIFMILATKGQI